MVQTGFYRQEGLECSGTACRHWESGAELAGFRHLMIPAWSRFGTDRGLFFADTDRLRTCIPVNLSDRTETNPAGPIPSPIVLLSSQIYSVRLHLLYVP